MHPGFPNPNGGMNLQIMKLLEKLMRKSFSQLYTWGILGLSAKPPPFFLHASRAFYTNKTLTVNLEMKLLDSLTFETTFTGPFTDFFLTNAYIFGALRAHH